MGSRSKCVLFVDDDEVVLDVGTMMLERVGYRIKDKRA